MKPCRHRDSVDGCRLCWLFDHDDDYRALWDDGEVDDDDVKENHEEITPEPKPCNCREPGRRKIR